MKPDQKIIDKIKKCLDLAEGAKQVGSLEEAATAMAQANKLLMKYNLDMSTVESEHSLDQDKVGSESELVETKKNEGKFTPMMYHIIAENNLCRIVTSDAGNNRIRIYIFGTKVNVQLVSYMSASIINQLRSMEKVYWKNYNGPEKRGRYRRGFFSGAQAAISSRLREEKVEMRKNVKVDALIKTNEVALQDKVNEVFKRGLGRGRASRSSSAAGRMDGHKAGQNVGLGAGLKSNKSNTQKQLR